ncbi:hypothetical protein [Spiroplasma poulsonii]|uniref:hypothetical protein n=1 Tax=Spiroplasma poulsonii TaxID=2138 RepID=UPI001F4C82A3|nr:hypothetical protein [Spiroplasma poulsonii]UNF61683.1 hypothetical protein MNU24_07165 [Spiroplasma poulsonii]
MIYFNDKTIIYWCYRNSIQHLKEYKNNLILVKEKHTIRNLKPRYQTETKNYCNKFSLGKMRLCFI